MLTELRIRDLGIITEIDLVVGPGMTALTGETGAGKTMLVEAISLLLGATADAAVVRRGAEAASVEGRFVDGDGEVVLARVVPADGRSRAYVDGRLATAATLADTGATRVDLHGQRGHERLLAPATQREALDRFATTDLTALRAARARVAHLDARLGALGGDARARAREVDLLRFQVDELVRAALDDPDEDEGLDAEEDLLAGAQAHREAAVVAHDALAGGDDAPGAADALGVALGAITGRSPFKDVEARLRAVAAEVADLASEARAVGESVADDPARLAAVGQRRQLLHELRRKYGDTLADVIVHRDETAARLAELEGYEATAAALEAERQEALASEAAEAAAVAAHRRRAAPRLAKAVERHLRQLAMPRARLEVAVDGPDPADDVRFLLGANPGEPVLPLSKVASGGELARAMLALRLVLSEAPGTLIFDEVDAGIGGEAALAVGRSLAALALRHQVLVVTHLPQVAAFADHQVAVSKAAERGRTQAQAVTVEGDARTRELSRMLSGRADSGTSRRHAVELLETAPAPNGQVPMAIHDPEVTEVVGRCRVDRRTKNLVQRLLPGEIAVIDHSDLDRVAAEALIEAGAGAVVNASSSMSGRYPNLGPLLIAAAGIPLIDRVGSHVLDVLVEGEVVAIVGGQVIVAGAVVAHGERQSMASIEDKIEEARRTVGMELERFASNTLEYLKGEHHLVTDSLELPPVPVSFRRRQALVVSRGDDYRDDLAALKRSGYLREVKPVLIGVDGGADALRDLGLTPDVIIGDFDSVREDTLHCGATLVVHAYPGGVAPGVLRLGTLGLEYEKFEAPGTSEDIALLLAFELGAELIVAVGLHSSLEEFLDKGRAGMSSTFLVRLKVGRILVDAKGVSRLYRPVVRRVDAVALVVAMLLALVAVALVNRPLQLWLRSLWLLLRSALGR